MKNYKEIKRTNNVLPKFNTGTVPSLNLPGLNNLQGVNISNAYYQSAPTLGGALQDPKNGQLGQIKSITQNAGSGGANWSNGGQIVQGAVQFTGATLNAFGNNKSSQEVLNESGQQSKQVMGVGYNYQNGPDEYQQMRDLSNQNASNTLATTGAGAGLGGAIGTAILPGVGSLLGAGIGAAVGFATGLIGSKSRKNKLRRQILNARRTAEARNTYSYAGAMSTGLQNEFYQDNGDTDNSILYANKGKDLPMYNTGKDSSTLVKVGKNTKVWSPTDYAGQIANAKVGLGESLVDFGNKSAQLVTKGKDVGTDDQYAKVDNNTFIAGNDRSWLDGRTFAEKAQPNTLAVMSLDKGLKATQKVLEKSSLAPSTMKYIDKRKDVYMNNLQTVADEQRSQHEHQKRYNTFMANHGKDLKRFNPGKDDFYEKYGDYFGPSNIGYLNSVTNKMHSDEINEWNKNIKSTYDPSYVNTFTTKQLLNNTKLPKESKIKTPSNHLISPWEQWTAHLPAAFGGLHQLLDSQRSSYIPNTYRSNTYAGLALNTLAKNRPNPYNQLRAINDSERQALYSLRGLGGGLRQQAALAAILGAGANRAGIYSNTEDKMNQYRTANANLASTLGQQDQAARIDAAKYAHNAMMTTNATKYKEKNVGWQNMVNAAEQTFADRFKLGLAEKQLAQYNQYLTRDQLALLRDYINKSQA